MDWPQVQQVCMKYLLMWKLSENNRGATARQFCCAYGETSTTPVGMRAQTRHVEYYVNTCSLRGRGIHMVVNWPPN